MRSHLNSKSRRKGLDDTHGHQNGQPVRSFPARLADEARFFKAWVENPGATGAVSPSGKALARAMAKPVDISLPGMIIELGPGTGPVTQALLDHGVAPERLIVIEYDAAFCTLLEKKFPGVRVVQGDAYNIVETLGELTPQEPVAAVVSSLPLLNRPESDRLKLLREAFGLLDPRGQFIQFTYGMVSPVPRSKNGQGVSFSATASPPVWLNLPPARVWCYHPTADVVQLGRGLPHTELIKRLKGGANKMRDGILERRDRIETEIRLVRDRMRIDIELRAARFRKELEMKPALALWKKINQKHRKGR